MKLYVLVHAQDGDYVRAYTGQSAEAIFIGLANEGKTGEIITQAQYEAFLAAHATVQPTPEEITLDQRFGAIFQLTSEPSPAAKLVRAVFMVALDEINLLRQRDTDHAADVAAAASLADLKTRWATRSNLSARTVAQFKTAVQNKINAGDAD